MAKRYLASEYEIRQIIDGDLGEGYRAYKDWYRQRYVVDTENLLHDQLRLEFPLALPRDEFDSSIIPGGISVIDDLGITQPLMKDLGVDPDADYIFFVMTGRFYSAHDNDPMRFTLVEPRRARDVILMASWQKGTVSPTNRHITESICDSSVAHFAIFEGDESGYHSATWVISAGSLLGERLVVEAEQQYAERLHNGIEHFRDYAHTCVKTRNGLWTRLFAEPRDSDERQPTARLTLYDFYLHAEWRDAGGQMRDDYYFYTDIGVNSILDLTRHWRDHDVVVGLLKMY